MTVRLGVPILNLPEAFSSKLGEKVGTSCSANPPSESAMKYTFGAGWRKD